MNYTPYIVEERDYDTDSIHDVIRINIAFMIDNLEHEDLHDYINDLIMETREAVDWLKRDCNETVSQYYYQLRMVSDKMKEGI